MNTLDKYLFQALDNYPFCLQETLESLEFSLSYNDKNTMALCLYGRIFAEQLQNYEEAKNYFEEAIAININAIEVYPYYIQTLIWNEDYEHANRLIDFSLTLKGIDKTEILLKKIQLLELNGKFKKSLKAIKDLKLQKADNDYKNFLEETEKRINEKIEIKNPKKKKPEKKKPKKKK